MGDKWLLATQASCVIRNNISWEKLSRAMTRVKVENYSKTGKTLPGLFMLIQNNLLRFGF